MGPSYPLGRRGEHPLINSVRGADVLVRAFRAAGIRRVFALSGNQIMAVFDACVGSDIELVHVRHEAAAVHMADAWARLTGEPGVALVTAGPGHANALSALYTAAAAEAPVILLSGHSPLAQLGRGAFQEMAQADLAALVAKQSWVASSGALLGRDFASAVRIAVSGRPGPVHLSLPSDVLGSRVEGSDVPDLAAAAFDPERTALDEGVAAMIAKELSRAERPLIIVGPASMSDPARESRQALEAAVGAPVVGMESPRGLDDPCLGAFAEVVAQADLIVLLGKPLDYALKFAEPPGVSTDCRLIHVDPDPALLARTRATLNGSPRLAGVAHADARSAIEALAGSGSAPGPGADAWRETVRAAVDYRPEAWRAIESGPSGPLHPVEVFRPVQALLAADANSVLVCDGGEYGQWGQACLSARHRLINGPAGAIGSALPYAMAARLACPDSIVVAVLGDGTFGFHMAEFDTAVRHGIPFLAVLGNDACWNAEYQIQLRDYGPDRAYGCELLPARYDRVAAALGAHGERVGSRVELEPALARALQSERPALVDVAIQRQAAPKFRRQSSRAASSMSAGEQ